MDWAVPAQLGSTPVTSEHLVELGHRRGQFLECYLATAAGRRGRNLRGSIGGEDSDTALM